MMTTDEAVSIVKDLGYKLVQQREKFGLSCIILFGSVARGTAGPNSDVDLLLVVQSQETYLTLHDFCEDLVCGGYPIDFTILTENSLVDTSRDVALKTEIRKDGIQVWP